MRPDRTCAKFFVVFLSFSFLLGIASMLRLPLWWDEGWTIEAAKNWAEYGFIGSLFEGKPFQGGLHARLPVLVPVKISFLLFGIGIWQARLPFLLLSLCALVFLFILASRLFGSKTALAAVVILSILSGFEHIHPILLGVQVLGEAPLYFFALGGYLFFLLSFEKSRLYLLPAILFWALAFASKFQFRPFWLFAFCGCTITSFLFGWRRISGHYVLLLVAVPIVYKFYDRIEARLFGQLSPFQGFKQEYTFSDLIEVTGIVPGVVSRERAFGCLVRCGLPLILGLSYWLLKAFRERMNHDEEGSPFIFMLKLSLWLLSASWLAWYLFFSNGWARYIAPPLYFGVFFAADFFGWITNGYSLSAAKNRLIGALRREAPLGMNALALLSVLLLCAGLSLTAHRMMQLFSNHSNVPLISTVDYLNRETPRAALIESYESELFFLLNRPVHYPPHDLHIKLNRKVFVDHSSEVRYDPLGASPDYLVCGPFCRTWGLYKESIEKGAFVPVKDFRRYQIYRRQS